MPEEAFPLPGSSFKQLEKIISSYSEMKAEAGPSEVAKLAGTDATNVSRNNKFLVAVGVVEGTLKKRVTPFGEKLGRSIQYSQPETESECWREMVERTEFFQKLISAVRIRRGMDSSTLTNHIAYSAGAPKNGQMMAGAGAILEILTRSGVLSEQGGLLNVAENKIPTELPVDQAENASTSSPWTDAFRSMGASGSLFAEQPRLTVSRTSDRTVSVQIEVQIACKPSDLETLGSQLRKLLADLKSDPDEGLSISASRSDVRDDTLAAGL